MRHRYSGKKLSRTTNQRRSLIKNQVRSLFTSGFIKTTYAKAVASKPMAEKYARIALKADLTSRRQLFSLLQDRHWVMAFEKAMVDTYKDHQQSFFKIIKLLNRPGDDALIVKLSFNKPIILAKKIVKESPNAKTSNKVAKKPAKKIVKKATKPTKKDDQAKK